MKRSKEELEPAVFWISCFLSFVSALPGPVSVGIHGGRAARSPLMANHIQNFLAMRNKAPLCPTSNY